jgi:hypothetical protein
MITFSRAKTGLPFYGFEVGSFDIITQDQNFKCGDKESPPTFTKNLDDFLFNRACILCHKQSKFHCNRCGANYCSKNCQISDFSNHKSDCVCKLYYYYL